MSISRLVRRPVAVALALSAALVLAACTVTVDGHPSGAGSVSPSSGAPGSGSVGAGTATAGPSSPDRAASDVPTAAPAQFFDCRSDFNLGVLTYPAGRLARLSIDCAIVKVPLNYADPNGTTIQVVLVRVHDSAGGNDKPPLLVNPGGPGASGVNLALSLSAQLSTSVLEHYDIVGFDPRGVGQSTPLHCIGNAEKDKLNAASPDVLTAAGFAQARSYAKTFADACERAYGASLPYFNTVETARDMNQLREALGQSSLDYLGFSYGTELGSVYAHLYPKTVHTMVLDGAVDPLTSGLTANANQLEGFEKAFDQFAAWCTVHSPCRTLGNARNAVYAIQRTALRTPIPSSNASDGRSGTYSLVTTGVLQALYSQSQWPTLATALLAARKGNSAGLLALADEYNERYHGSYETNIADANLAISCNDSAPGPSDATIRATAKTWAGKYPIFGLWSAPSLFNCQQWQPTRTIPPKPTASTTPRTVLVVGNLHDPATPYQGALDLAKVMGNARVLTWNGEGHTSYLQGSSCVDDAVNAYLDDGTLPAAGKVCPR